VGDGDVADEIANGQGRVGGGGEQGGGDVRTLASLNK
jgi:hypothetical protein